MAKAHHPQKSSLRSLIEVAETDDIENTFAVVDDQAVVENDETQKFEGISGTLYE